MKLSLRRRVVLGEPPWGTPRRVLGGPQQRGALNLFCEMPTRTSSIGRRPWPSGVARKKCAFEKETVCEDFAKILLATVCQEDSTGRGGARESSYIMLSVHFCCVYMWDSDSAGCNTRSGVSSPREYFNMERKAGHKRKKQ
ncbi:uncharacterized protein LOC125515709 isoform X1 [Triticum urartu]|uniref:uncharacterized protein LOC125515709 isoform X1 n=1 Tax=Triticum urartu TaxID=4572 RepID=UPI002044C664|nr:uncharacterized protein LOC125515709 isoform X1 [Triticum urartu]